MSATAPLQLIPLGLVLEGPLPGLLLQTVVEGQAQDIGQHLLALARRLLGELVGPPLPQEGAVDEG
ncbi:MAG: hypothetical protein V1780_02980, partial [Chloroflexota bacterium]